MYLGTTEPGAWIRTSDVASAFGISLSHLQKAVQGLVRAGYVEALQGRAGGVRLAREADTIRIGTVVAHLEGSGCLVDCERGPCPLAGACVLKVALDGAERVFIRELDRFTLADVLVRKTGGVLRGMIAARGA
jgi:Rrf2 family nitric oxide-sensitive transcriptional repressor